MDKGAKAPKEPSQLEQMFNRATNVLATLEDFNGQLADVAIRLGGVVDSTDENDKIGVESEKSQLEKLDHLFYKMEIQNNRFSGTLERLNRMV